MALVMMAFEAAVDWANFASVATEGSEKAEAMTTATMASSGCEVGLDP